MISHKQWLLRCHDDSANAVANKKNSIAFNPAVPSLGKYGF